MTSGVFSSDVFKATLDECKDFIDTLGIKTVIAEYTPGGGASAYKCIAYSTCGSLIKDCTAITYVLSIESLTPSTVAAVPCAYCDSYPLSAVDTNVITISDFDYSATGTETVLTKAVLGAKF